MHELSIRFHEKLKELGELHDKKSLDYGITTDPFHNVRASIEWGMPGWVGACLRMSDKQRRLQAAARGSELANEGVIDSFDDMAVYSIIGGILYEEEHGLLVPRSKPQVNRKQFREAEADEALRAERAWKHHLKVPEWRIQI